MQPFITPQIAAYHEKLHDVCDHLIFEYKEANAP